MSVNRFEVAQQINKLEDWFGKQLKGVQFETFVDRLVFIPPKAMEDIVDRYIDDNQPSPGKFPTVAKIRQGWESWKADHPDLVVKHARTDCKDCGGHGFIWFRKLAEETNLVCEFVARCGSCENWKSDVNHLSPIPIMRKAQIMAMGLEIVSFGPKRSAAWPPRNGGVDGLNKHTFQSTPDGSEHYQKIQRQKQEILDNEQRKGGSHDLKIPF